MSDLPSTWSCWDNGSGTGVTFILPQSRDVTAAGPDAATLPCGTVTDPNADPTIRRLREQIADNDRSLVEAINARLRLVSSLKRHKESRGLDFLDPERERSLVRDLERGNRGPLSPEGLRELYVAILDLTKREVSREP